MFVCVCVNFLDIHMQKFMQVWTGMLSFYYMFAITTAVGFLSCWHAQLTRLFWKLWVADFTIEDKQWYQVMQVLFWQMTAEKFNILKFDVLQVTKDIPGLNDLEREHFWRFWQMSNDIRGCFWRNLTCKFCQIFVGF